MKISDITLLLSALIIVFVMAFLTPAILFRKQIPMRDGLGINMGEIEIKPDEKSSITLVATGDIMLGRSVNAKIQEERDPTFPFQNVNDLLKSADITLINLENPLFDPCPITNEGMIFCAPTSSVSGLVNSGIDVVNIANNHTRNYGVEGYESTKNALNNAGISYDDSENLAIKNVDGTKFGFLGFDLVTNELTDEFISEKITEENEKVDVLVVSFHWGVEYAKDSSNYQENIARLAIDSGTDLVIGHHPHVVQPIEVYQDVPIIYSLGNFVFDQLWSEETRKGAVGVFNFEDGKLTDYKLLPIYINSDYQPELVEN